MSEMASKKVTLTQGTLDERIRYFLRDNYACTRVWEAWSYGTMTEDDFVPMDEDEDIVNDLKTLIKEEVKRLRGLVDKAEQTLVEWYVQDQADVIGTYGAREAAYREVEFLRMIKELPE